MTFGNFLRQIRHERGIPRSMLLARTGLTEKRLAALESNTDVPTYEEILKLARLLGEPEQALLAQAGYIGRAAQAVR